jgi:hypothetical protein
VLDPEVAAVFPNSAAVNKALHSLVEVAESVSGRTSGSSRPARLRRGGLTSGREVEPRAKWCRLDGWSSNGIPASRHRTSRSTASRFPKR